jgi:exodeoxyribonuclease V alpha subunit
MTVTPQDLLAGERIGRLDFAFAEFIERHSAPKAEDDSGRTARRASTDRALVALAAAAVSSHTSAGHVCLSVSKLGGTLILDPEAEFEDGTPDAAEGEAKSKRARPEVKALMGLRWPNTEEWLSALRQSPCVSDGSTLAPMVLDAAGRLYLHRYWEHERRVVGWLDARVAAPPDDVDAAWLSAALERLFPPEPSPASDPAATTIQPDWRRLAALAVLTRRFTIISGGPGTGKTSAVIRLLTLLLEQAEAKDRLLRIALVAPTGKAAARLQETVDMQRPKLPTSETVRAALPTESTTLHRRLGAFGTGFRYGPDDRIPYDVVVVDEASMVDVVLLSRLIAAMEDGARLILLGDRDQLASVQAGAVLGDLCRLSSEAGYSEEFAARFAAVSGAGLPAGEIKPGPTGFGDAVVQLRRNFRFNPNSGIGALAAAIVVSDSAKVLSVLSTSAPGTVELVSPVAGGTAAVVSAMATKGYRPYLSAPDVASAYKSFLGFRILCAHRSGDTGVAQLNPAIEKQLGVSGLIAAGAEWYPGRPVMVTQNDAALRLFNGDVGLAWLDPAGVLLVHFPDGKGGFRTFQPTRLPPHETVYAMTVHKSQGSEFGRVVLVLPEKMSRVLTRELVYTGVTRAVDGVVIVGTAAVLTAGVEGQVERESGVGGR